MGVNETKSVNKLGAHGKISDRLCQLHEPEIFKLIFIKKRRFNLPKISYSIPEIINSRKFSGFVKNWLNIIFLICCLFRPQNLDVNRAFDDREV